MRRWCRHEGGLGVVGRAWWHRRKVRVIGTGPFALRPEHILTVVFTGNFIGIICARTLHYQFYAWCAVVNAKPAKPFCYSWAVSSSNPLQNQ